MNELRIIEPSHDRFVGMTVLFGKVYAWVHRDGKLHLQPTWEKTDG